VRSILLYRRMFLEAALDLLKRYSFFAITEP
jgi:hypothetical protein